MALGQMEGAVPLPPGVQPEPEIPVGTRFGILHLRGSEPAGVTEGVLHFVPIPVYPGTGPDRFRLEIPESSESPQRLPDLVTLLTELGLVIQMLQSASTADPEMDTARLILIGAVPEDLHQTRLGVSFLHLVDQGRDLLSRQCIIHEDRHAFIGPADAPTAKRQAPDLEFDDLFFLQSTHTGKGSTLALVRQYRKE